MKKGLTDIFEVDSLLKVLVLCVLTIGTCLIYKLYWFYSVMAHPNSIKIRLVSV